MAQNVLKETGFPNPSTLVGNGNQDAVTVLALAKRSAKRLAEEYPWAVLTKEHEFVLVKDKPSYELPDDFSRFINGTMWDRVESRPMDYVGPQIWQEYKSGLVKTAIYKRWRIKGVEGAKELFVDPTPSATQCSYECRDGTKVRIGVAFEYLSSHFAAAANGDTKADFTVDTDTFLLPDDLLELDLKWRWLNSLGQTYFEEKNEFDRALSIYKAQDGGTHRIQMDGGRTMRYPNIPETGVGL